MAGQALALLFDMSDEEFAAVAEDDDDYDLVDFDADLDDAEDLAAANAA